ncbi:MAG TPA: C1 family peptidase [Stenomitos sp.]
MLGNRKLSLLLLALSLALPGCGVASGLQANLGSDTTLDANGLPMEARTIKTEIGSITLGLLPNKRPASESQDEAVGDYESELGLGLSVQAQTLPAKADLRSYFASVRNQGQLGSCAAFATTSVMEATLKIKGKKPSKLDHLAPLFFYYATRQAMQDSGRMAKATKRDTGSFMDLAARTAVKIGAPSEDLVPYRDGKTGLAYDPTDAEYAAAKDFHMLSTKRVSTVKGMKSALAAKHPIIIGVPLYQSFMTKALAQSGQMTLPQKGEQIVGGHAMAVVGYDDAKESFLIRNSWGSDWGQGGYFYMPYDYFQPSYIGKDGYFSCYIFE